MNENVNNGYDTKFIDEKGEEEVMHIESANDYKVNMNNNNKYKLMNSKNKNGEIFRSFNKKRRNMLLRDVGFKSNGFAQVASLSVIIVIASIFVLYLLLRF